MIFWNWSWLRMVPEFIISTARSLNCPPGNIFLIMPGIAHSYINEDNLELYSYLFFADFLDHFRSELELISGYHLLFSLEPIMGMEKRMSGNLYISPPILNKVIRSLSNDPAMLSGTVTRLQSGNFQ